jgi:four helix bundle protein
VIEAGKKNDLCERLFEFAVRVIEFLKMLPYSPENKTIRTQLSKSACSSGANYEEAQSGSSKADFSNKVRIALREMRESNFKLSFLLFVKKQPLFIKTRLYNRPVLTNIN